MYGAVDKGKAKTAEAMVTHGAMRWPTSTSRRRQSQVEEKVSVAYSKAASITSDVCYDKIPSLYEKHAKKYVDAAIEIGEPGHGGVRACARPAGVHDRVQQLKEKLPTSSDLKWRTRRGSGRPPLPRVVGDRGACDETSAIISASRARRERLASACVACWAARACCCSSPPTIWWGCCWVWRSVWSWPWASAPCACRSC